MKKGEVKCVRSNDVIGVTRGKTYYNDPPEDALIRGMVFIVSDSGKAKWVKNKFFEDNGEE